MVVSGKKTRPKDYPKLKRYKPSKFMLETSHYDKAKADRAVIFIENLCQGGTQNRPLSHLFNHISPSAYHGSLLVRFHILF